MFIVVKNNKIILADTDQQRLINTLTFMPDLEGSEILEVADEEIERGFDGGYYYKGTAPVRPESERFEMLRSARDAKLTATDYLVMPDYPIEAEKLEAVKVYRQALRDLPSQDGAPWDGGGEGTPWPILPEV